MDKVGHTNYNWFNDIPCTSITECRGLTSVLLWKIRLMVSNEHWITKFGNS